MAQSLHVNVDIDPARIVENVRAIKQKVGVRVLPVIKADAYGFRAADVTRALAEVADGFCVFSVAEAIAIEYRTLTDKPPIALGPPRLGAPDWYVRHGVRPAVTTVEEARELRGADPVLCVDTGMQRFACPPDKIEAVIEAGDIHEAFTHATRIEHVEKLVELLGGRGMT